MSCYPTPDCPVSIEGEIRIDACEMGKILEANADAFAALGRLKADYALLLAANHKLGFAAMDIKAELAKAKLDNESYGQAYVADLNKIVALSRRCVELEDDLAVLRADRDLCLKCAGDAQHMRQIVSNFQAALLAVLNA